MITLKTFYYSFFKVWFPLIISFFLLLFIIFYSGEDIINLLTNVVIESEYRELAFNLATHFNFNVKLLILILSAMQVIIFLRKLNARNFYNSNGNIYYDHTYLTFWVASKILGYESIQLAGIPLSMQFKLIIRGTFKEIKVDMWETQYKELDEKNDNFEIKKFHMEILDESKDINLLICDTYDIPFENIHNDYIENPTIKLLSSMQHTAIRYEKLYLINNIQSVLRELPRNKNLNIFTTANPKNNLNIVVSCFRFFDRSGFASINVVERNDYGNYVKKVKIL